MKFIRPKRYAEANVQAEFYHRCRLLKLRLCLEYTCNNCRFDAVMIDNNDNIYAIVEFKRSTKGYVSTKTKQLKKYSKYGVPILICINFEGINDTIIKCQELLKNANTPQIFNKQVGHLGIPIIKYNIKLNNK